MLGLASRREDKRGGSPAGARGCGNGHGQRREIDFHCREDNNVCIRNVVQVRPDLNAARASSGAEVAELADALGSGPSGHLARAGSNPAFGTVFCAVAMLRPAAAQIGRLGRVRHSNMLPILSVARYDSGLSPPRPRNWSYGQSATLDSGRTDSYGQPSTSEPVLFIVWAESVTGPLGRGMRSERGG